MVRSPSALSDYVHVFIDNILILSESAEEHVEHVKTKVEVLRHHSILRLITDQNVPIYMGPNPLASSWSHRP